MLAEDSVGVLEASLLLVLTSISSGSCTADRKKYDTRSAAPFGKRHPTPVAPHKPGVYEWFVVDLLTQRCTLVYAGSTSNLQQRIEAYMAGKCVWARALRHAIHSRTGVS
jgi:hypothetical protein